MISEKERQILNAALDLFVKNGFHGTPTIMVAKKAKVSNGTLFHYYKTKDALILALYKDIKQDLQLYLDTHYKDQQKLRDRFRQNFYTSITWAMDNPERFTFIQQFNHSPYASGLSKNDLNLQTAAHYALIELGIKQRIIKDLPKEFLFTVISNSVFAMFQYASTKKITKTKLADLIEEGFEILWNGIKI